MNMSDEYWSLDIPGLSEQQAKSVYERLDEEFAWGVTVIDPRDAMTRGFDRSSVEILRYCLRAGIAAKGMSEQDQWGAESLLEDCEEWLAQARA